MIDVSRGRFYARHPYEGWAKAGDWYETDDPNLVAPHIGDIAPWAAARIAYVDAPRRVYSGDCSSFVPPGAQLDDYQLESLGYALTGDDVLLADDAGLGKTVIAAVALNAWDARRVLIVCPSSVKYNWKKELLFWRPPATPPAHVVEGDDYDVDATTVIINYDLLARHEKKLKALEWDAIIYDESQRFINPKSNRTKIALGFGRKKPIPARKRIFASATPMDKPKHLWPMCRACDPAGLGADWFKFITRYCNAFHSGFGWNDNGASHTDELARLLRERFMVRHTDSVLNLPPYVESMLAVPRTATVRVAQVDMLLSLLKMDDVVEDVRVREKLDALRHSLEKAGGDVTVLDGEIDDTLRVIGESLAEQASNLRGVAPMFEQLSAYRKLIAVEKTPYALAYIDVILSRSETEPLLIFCHHKEVVATICAALTKKGVTNAHISGSVSAKKREDIKVAFQNGEIRVIVANMAAGGEGITLTASNHVLFIETDWKASTIRQSLKRVHRRTQTRPCSIEYLIMDNTVDAYVTQVFLNKRQVTSEILG